MILIESVSKRYGKQAAVRDVSLEVPAGSAFGLLGRNGAGKTTLMKMLVGLARPDAGRVMIGGRPAGDTEARARIGFMPEAPYFYERLSGLEFMLFSAELFPRECRAPRKRCEDILDEVGLGVAARRPIRTYSKGMRARLGFAQALVNDPEYVFLDEPLDGLDPIGRLEMKEMIRRFAAAGKTVFLNSHILFDIEELCGLVGVIDRGALLYAGPVQGFSGGEPLEQVFVARIQKMRHEL